jgi:hypothetical protein
MCACVHPACARGVLPARLASKMACPLRRSHALWHLGTRIRVLHARQRQRTPCSLAAMRLVGSVCACMHGRNGHALHAWCRA